jgi:CBS domain-containing protein
MEMHDEAGNISALQGGVTRGGAQWDLMQQRWSPTTRLLMGAGAASLLACASGRAALAVGIVGLGLFSLSPNRGNRSRGPQRAAQHNGSMRAVGRQAQRGRQGGFSDRRAFDFREEQSMKVSDIMTPSPATCHADTNLMDVARLMLQCDCGAIPVVHPGTNEPVGIITDRDITIRTIAEGRNPLELKTSDCMTSPVESISCEASLDECTDKMEASQVRRMIVVDEDNQICGIIAQADIAMYAPREETAELVQDVSAPAPVPTI